MKILFIGIITAAIMCGIVLAEGAFANAKTVITAEENVTSTPVLTTQIPNELAAAMEIPVEPTDEKGKPSNPDTETPEPTAAPVTTETETQTLTPTASYTALPTFDETAFAERFYEQVTETAEAWWLIQTPTITPTVQDADLTTGLQMLNPTDCKNMVFIHTTGTDYRGFWLYWTEVTNGEYQKCIENGGCTVPRSAICEHINNYFSSGLYREFPVVNLTRKQADAYCSWAGMTLMSFEDWKIASELFPNENTVCGYQTEIPTKSGDFGPQLTGNVWEWTSSLTDEGYGIIAGGSWKTSPQDISSGRFGVMSVDQIADDTGFRCVRYVY